MNRSDPQADVADVWCHPTEKHVQTVSFIHARKRWQILDPTIQPDLDYLRSVAKGEVEIVSRALLKKHSPLTYADRICRPLLI
jgi:hypothetical protein